MENERSAQMQESGPTPYDHEEITSLLQPTKIYPPTNIDARIEENLKPVNSNDDSLTTESNNLHASRLAEPNVICGNVQFPNTYPSPAATTHDIAFWHLDETTARNIIYPPLSPNSFATAILDAALPNPDQEHQKKLTCISQQSQKQTTDRNHNALNANYPDALDSRIDLQIGSYSISERASQMGNANSSTESTETASLSPVPSTSTQSSNTNQCNQYTMQSSSRSSGKKSVFFDKVEVYHFTRTQGFSSIPSQGGSTLGMKRKHFFKRKLSVDLFEEVRRRSRREILLKIKYDKNKRKPDDEDSSSNCNSNSSSSSSKTASSDSDEESFSDLSDISDSELESDSYIFLQPVGVKLRRSLLRASGVGRIDPKEKRECKSIRESRERSGCRCVNQCIPELCECSRLGVNCHVDRVSFPCGCVSDGCRNPEGRTEFDIKRVKGHLLDTLVKSENDEI